MSFPIILTGGQVTVNKDPMTVVDLVCPAWGTHDEGFSQLGLGPKMLGDPISVPGEYDRSQRRQPVATTRRLPLFIVSECDHTGALFLPNEGVWSNLAYLRAHVLDDPAAVDRPDGSREVVFATPDGTEYEANCQFEETVISQPTPSGWYMEIAVNIMQGSFRQLVS